MDLSGYLDNTDTDDQTLTLSSNTLSIEHGNSVDLSGYLDDTDTDDQTLSFSGTDLTIADGNTVGLATLKDNLGSHTASQNIQLNGHWLSNDGGSEGVSIDNSGNVGIGTNTPNHLLDLGGSIGQKLALYQTPSGNDFYGFGIGSGALEIYASANSPDNPDVVVISTGNVGVGTETPSDLLHVHSNAGSGIIKVTGNGAGTTRAEFEADRTNSARGGGLRVTTNGTTDWWVGVGYNGGGASNDFIIDTDDSFSGGAHFTIQDGTGNVGIGSNGPSQKLHVAGNICYTGAAFSCSDLRYKKDITVLPNVLEKLEQINGVYYNWKVEEFPENEFSKDRQIGVIAQELEQVYPELVITDANGYKTVVYPKLTAVLIEANKDLLRQVEGLSRGFEIQSSKARAENEAIKAELEIIKAALNLNCQAEK